MLECVYSRDGDLFRLEIFGESFFHFNVVVSLFLLVHFLREHCCPQITRYCKRFFSFEEKKR